MEWVCSGTHTTAARNQVGNGAVQRRQRGRVRTSSREMSSLEKVRPGMRPRFFSQKIAQKEPEKKMPSTTANATRRSAKRDDSVIHFSALRRGRGSGELG